MQTIFYFIKFSFYSFYLFINFSFFPHKKSENAVKLRLILQKLGPTFIKLGQTISSRQDIIGPEFAAELSILQDKLPPFPFEFVQSIIETELEKKFDEIFIDFEQTAHAAASIAQVHKAITNDNQIVAVKIIRPNIEKLFARDIKFLFFIANFAEYFFKKTRRLKLIQLVNLFYETVQLELDLRLEAAAASELAENNKDNLSFYIPKIYWLLTSKNVLTLEWIEGISINEKEKIVNSNYDIKEICKNLAVGFFNQAYREGFFHADMHPGNLKIRPDNKIALIDFGIMGRLNYQNRIYVAEILYSFLKRDYNRVAELHFDAGHVSNDKSVKLFAQACRALGEPIMTSPNNRISVGKLLSQLFQITANFNMETQIELVLLQKTTIMIEGLARKLDPNINLWKLAEPWIENWAIINISPEAKFVKFTKIFAKNLINRPHEKGEKSIINNNYNKNYYIWKKTLFFCLITALLVFYLTKNWII